MANAQQLVGTAVLFALLFAPLDHLARVGAVSAAQDDSYLGQLPSLQPFIQRYAKHKKNHIRIARVRNDDGHTYLYGYWVEDKSILLLDHFKFDLAADPTLELSSLYRKARIDLQTDVVATSAEIRSSTYLVDRAWADRIINACRAERAEIVLARRAASPKH